MPGLIRGVARTAVIAGTATARVQPRVAPPGQQVGPAGRTAGSAAAAERRAARSRAGAQDDDQLAQLKELGELKAQGILTDGRVRGAEGQDPRRLKPAECVRSVRMSPEALPHSVPGSIPRQRAPQASRVMPVSASKR